MEDWLRCLQVLDLNGDIRITAKLFVLSLEM